MQRSFFSSSLFPSDALLDDRSEVTVGKKLKDVTSAGIPYAVLFGKDLLASEAPKVEVHDLYRGQVSKVGLQEAVQCLREMAERDG